MGQNMKKKRQSLKLTGFVLLVLILCTGLSRQFEAMLLPQVMAVPLGPGTIMHQDTYQAAVEDGMISWILDSEGYKYYGENSNAKLDWVDADGERQKEVFKITDKQQKEDGTWCFAINAQKVSEQFNKGNFDILNVTMESEISYPYTIPLSALSMRGDGYSVFMIETRQGIFSDEQTVHSFPQEILDQDNFTAAVSAGWADQVVAYTSKPLIDNMRVVIVEQ